MEIAQNELFKKQDVNNDEVQMENNDVQVTADQNNKKERVYLNYAAKGLDNGSCDEDDDNDNVAYTVDTMTAV